MRRPLPDPPRGARDDVAVRWVPWIAAALLAGSTLLSLARAMWAAG